jgi:hypothetical protein
MREERDGAVRDVDEKLKFMVRAGDVGGDGLDGVGSQLQKLLNFFLDFVAIVVEAVFVVGVEEALVENDGFCLGVGEGFDLAGEDKEGGMG